MKLTRQVAEANLGKYIDCYRRVLGIYPYKIIKDISGEILLQDRIGVCTPIPEKDTDPNCQHYDYMFVPHTGTCEDCGRNSDALDDGTTNCPIEEHYALPKDGFCHLWEESEGEQR